MKTFRCDFGNGVTCEVQVSDEPPAKGEAHVRGVEWTGNATRKHFRPYVAWMNTVNVTLAKEWGMALMHCFQTSTNEAETWMYVPGKPARFIGKVRKSTVEKIVHHPRVEGVAPVTHRYKPE